MAGRQLSQDVKLVWRGLKKVGSAAAELRSKQISKTWENSSLKPLPSKAYSSFQETIGNINQTDIKKNASEAVDRLATVAVGIQEYAKFQTGTSDKIPHINSSDSPYDVLENPTAPDVGTNPNFASQAGNYISDNIYKVNQSINETTKSFEQIKNEVYQTRPITDEDLDAINKKLDEIGFSSASGDVNDLKSIDEISEDNGAIKFENSTNIPQKNFATHSNIHHSNNNNVQRYETVPNISDSQVEDVSTTIKETVPVQPPTLIGRKPLSKSEPQSRLSSQSRARKVPHSQVGRLAAFGGLAFSLTGGAIAEAAKQAVGIKKPNSEAILDSSKFLSEANVERIVATLCKVRGAALKLGQMLSIQDESMMNSHLQKIMERVRQSADFMPYWQLEKTLIKSMGPDWKSKVASFDEKPFAAASIGQVHQAILHDGRRVAMKIQYPGVADSIESDINNLISTLKYANVFPAGLYVDSAIEVAKRELAWECDYAREKECTIRYRKLMENLPDYYVPEVIEELCTNEIFTSELIDGIPVDQCIEMDQLTRNRICELILELCLREVFEFGFMQTDPNWSNFFYNTDTQQITLLDFGACREYKKEFVDEYINVIHGAATSDRNKIYEHSKNLGFLTGYESKIMKDAHIDAVMILGEAFQKDEPFSFGNQRTTQRVHNLIPVMLDHRICPPPEESYSLHRKMAGAFLLCAKLKGVVRCKPFFDQIYQSYQPDVLVIGRVTMSSGRPVAYLTRTEKFSACHRLHSFQLSDEENIKIFGLCNNPNGHGHNYTLQWTVKGPVDSKTGMVMNITEMKELIKNVVMAVYDHKNIDLDVAHFKKTKMVSTTENVAIQIYEGLQCNLPPGVSMHEVQIKETDKNAVIFKGEYE